MNRLHLLLIHDLRYYIDRLSSQENVVSFPLSVQLVDSVLVGIAMVRVTVNYREVFKWRAYI